jgi:tetratricopeptide (TPR) repeat protein
MSSMQWLFGRFARSWLLFAGLFAVCHLQGQTQTLEDVLARAREAQSSGNYAGAANDYARATSLSPATAELWSNRGLMEFLGGEMDAAKASLKHALRLNPDLFIPMLFLGKVYLQTEQPSLALPYLNHAHTLQPEDVEVLLGLGKANVDLKQQRLAQSFYEKAARIAPTNPRAWFGLGVASLGIIAADGQSLAASQARSVWARALYADELLAQGRPVEAIDTYNAVLDAASSQQTATLLRNLEWLQMHPDLILLPPNSQEALQKLTEQRTRGQASAAFPGCGTASTALENAACTYWASDYQHSADEAQQSLRQSPSSAEALYWSIKANERVAVNALSRYEELAPQSATSYDLVGDLYRDQRENDSALGEYKKALAIDARDPGALMGATLANLSIAHLGDAETLDQTALADRPLDPQLNLLMAEILAAQNRLDKMQPYLAKCRTAPAELQPRVHLLLGRVAAQDGKTEEAIAQFKLAIPGDRDGSIHYQLSRLYRKTGNVAQAEKAEAEAKVLIKQRYMNAMTVVREAAAANP